MRAYLENYIYFFRCLVSTAFFCASFFTRNIIRLWYTVVILRRIAIIIYCSAVLSPYTKRVLHCIRQFGGRRWASEKEEENTNVACNMWITKGCFVLLDSLIVAYQQHNGNYISCWKMINNILSLLFKRNGLRVARQKSLQFRWNLFGVFFVLCVCATFFLGFLCAIVKTFRFDWWINQIFPRINRKNRKTFFSCLSKDMPESREAKTYHAVGRVTKKKWFANEGFRCFGIW